MTLAGSSKRSWDSAAVQRVSQSSPKLNPPRNIVAQITQTKARKFLAETDNSAQDLAELAATCLSYTIASVRMLGCPLIVSCTFSCLTAVSQVTRRQVCVASDAPANVENCADNTCLPSTVAWSEGRDAESSTRFYKARDRL